MITALKSTGGKGARNAGFLYLPSSHVHRAPKRVARLPKSTSSAMAPESRFPSRQPINSPGTAAPI